MRNLFVVFLLSAILPVTAGLRPVELRTEYRVNPQGIDVPDPRFSWILETDDPTVRGLAQSAYQILAASSAEMLDAGHGDLWDSGKTVSDDSTQIPYAGQPLASGACVWWKVRVWDQAGNPTHWSEPGNWSMGLLAPSDWKGCWIGLDGGEDKAVEWNGAQWIWVADAGSGLRWFKREFQIPSDNPATAGLLSMIGPVNAVAYLNGEQILESKGEANAVGISSTRFFKGTNTLMIRSEGGRRPCGVIAALDIDCVSGPSLMISTDSSWRAGQTEADCSESARALGSYGIAPWGEIGRAERRVLPARMLRRDFRLSGIVKRATAHVSGLGLFELYLNGRKVGDDVLVPALSEYDKRVFYLTYDVTGRLRPDANAVGVWLGNGRYFAPRIRVPTYTRTYGYPKLLLQIDIEYQDGSRTTVVSDGRWKITDNGPLLANNEYDGEIYDARREMPGWSEAGFDDRRWRPTQVVGSPAGRLAAQMSEPIRVREILKPVKLTELRRGVYIFDFGQNMVGWCRLTVRGPRGTRVTLRHAETLRPEGTLYVDNLRSARAADTYVLKGGGLETYEPRFVFHGFRYVEMTGFPGVPDWTALEGRTVHDAVEQIADFRTSNPLLDRIHRNVVWGTKGNYRSIPTDCPQRDERQGWLGDRSSSSRGETYMFDVAAMQAKWIDDMGDSQREQGSLSDIAPAYWPFYSDNVTWPASFVIIPGNLYDQYGDRRVLERHYEGMKRWVNHMRTYMQDGLMPRDNYGDWCVPPESLTLILTQDPARMTDKTMLGTTYFCHIMELMARYAGILEKPQEATEFGALATQMKDALNRKFLDRKTGRYSNGSQTSSILPLAFGITPAGDRASVFDALVRNIREQHQGHIGTGLIGAQWLMRTLSDNGRPDVAYEIAAQKTYPSWGYMIGKGATTIWELWNGDTADPAMNSGNHVMLVGDLIVWFYERLAGIRPDPTRPGFKHVILKPVPVDELTYVEASHRSPYGRIESRWKRTAGRFSWEIALPPNTTATVYVPARDAAAVTESGLPAVNAPGLHFLRMEAGRAVFETGSGRYSFLVR